jgi:hypothetical protein
VKADADGRLKALEQGEAAVKRREAALALREEKLEAREDAVADVYKVGPGKPPLETRFQKGTSGNPSGRPKIESLREMFLKVANKRVGSIAAEEDGIDAELSKLEAAMLAMFESARQGDNVAMKQVLMLTRAFIPEPTAARKRKRAARAEEATANDADAIGADESEGEGEPRAIATDESEDEGEAHADAGIADFVDEAETGDA